jgi:uncharacterized protein (DUF488 family)
MQLAPLTLWAIGHSTRPIEDFIAVLKAHDIESLADVRQFPGSRRYPQFGKDALAKSLTDAVISYTHFPDLGGRRRPQPNSPNSAWRNEAFRGYADYMMTPPFTTAVERLLKLACQKRTAIMCAELLWWRCHRSLISDYLKAHGHRVLHIMDTKNPQEHPFTSAARLINGKLTYSSPESNPEFAF